MCSHVLVSSKDSCKRPWTIKTARCLQLWQNYEKKSTKKWERREKCWLYDLSTVYMLFVLVFVRIKLHSQWVVFTFQRLHRQGPTVLGRPAAMTGFSSIIPTGGFLSKRPGAEERPARTEAQSAPAYSSNRTPFDRRAPLPTRCIAPIGQVDISLRSVLSPRQFKISGWSRFFYITSNGGKIKCYSGPLNGEEN